jgi:hypothetical protein
MDMDVVGNKERLLKGILDGETTTDIEPAGNEERLLYGILKGEAESNIEPASRVERLLKAILENGGGGGGGTGVVTKTIEGTVANPFSAEEANEIWNAIHGGTGDAHLTFTLPSFGSVTARFGAEPYEEGVNVLLASITAPVGSQVAALCLMYLVQEDNLFLAQKLAYAITPSSEPSVMDASALISNNLATLTALTKYNTQLVLDSLDATYNGTYNAPDGVAYDPVTVNVPQTIVESKTITENGTYTAESGKAFSPVTVAVPVPTLETKSVTANGNYDAPSGKAWNRVEVNVAAVSKLPEVASRIVKEITAADLGNTISSIGANGFSGCSVLNSVTLPSTISTLKDYAFSSCASLTSIVMPSVRRIENSVFAYCTSLASITIPSSVTSIGSSAFSDCTSLASITLPPNLTSIGAYAFRRCSSLASVTVEATTPPTLGNNTVFNGCHADLVIYVPAASVSAYQSATNWSTYASKIQAIPNS